jgi:hypothetical protein
LLAASGTRLMPTDRCASSRARGVVNKGEVLLEEQGAVACTPGG